MKIFKDKKIIVVLAAIFALGVAMMLYKPEKRVNVESNVEVTENDDIEKKLEKILSDVKGAGRVSVMITYKTNGEKIYAYNFDKQTENDDSSITQSEKNEMVMSKDEPVVLKEYKPEIEGVLVVSDGGGDEQIKNNLTSAVKALLAVDVNKIEVLVMKKEA